MAEAHFDQLAGGGNPLGGDGFTSYINGFGAVLSLALVGAVVAWGYQLAVRDVAGVPVIRALESPMRVQPENPGGLATDHQGLSVNEVQAGGSGEPAEALTLAPRPVALSEEDKAAAELAAAEAAVAHPEEEITQALAAVTGDGQIKTAADLAVAAALAQELLADEVTIEAVVEVSSQNAASPLDDLLGPAVAVRPLLRPKRMLAPGTVLDVDPATLPLGTRLVQLGAFGSEDEAKTEWTRLADGYGAYMSDKKRIIQRTESSGRVFFRLRAVGFTDLSDARRFCAAILGSDASCIPVLTR